MSPLSLAAVLRSDFPASIRERGESYWRRGAVQLERMEPGEIEARVLGTQWYRVGLGWSETDPDGVWCDCTCPACEREGICKHVWALILAADAQAASPVKRVAAARRPPKAAPITWRQRVRAMGLLEAETRAHAGAARESQVLYTLAVEESIEEGAPVIRLLQRLRKKNGDWGTERPLSPTPGARAKITDGTDRALLSLLEPFPRPVMTWYGSYGDSQATRAIAGEAALDLLPRLAATGRLFWTAERGAGLLAWDEGPAWELRIDVDLGRKEAVARGSIERVAGGQRERHDLDEPLALFELGLVVLPGSLARFDARGGMAWCVGLRRMGPIRAPRAEAPELLDTVLGLAAGAIGPAVDPASENGAASGFEIGGLRVADAPPRPSVRIERPRRRSGSRRLDCHVSFDYSGVHVAATDPGRFVRLPDADGKPAGAARRDLAREEAALARLGELGMRRSSPSLRFESAGTLAASRLGTFTRALIAEGWTVEAEGALHRSAGATGVSVKSGVDWFEIEGAVEFGDQRATFPEILAAVRQRRDTVKLGDGSFGVLPERWLERWGLLSLAGKTDGDALRVPRAQAWLLDALLAAAQPDRADVDKAFARTRERLAGFERVEAAREPTGFHGELREYQREGLGWLAFLREMGLGGCLADDMGLGKTVQVLAHLLAVRPASKRARRPSLVVAPRSLIFNWIDEAARFAPDLAVHDHTGTDRAARLKRAGGADLIVTTYGTLRRDAAALAKLRFDTVVLDEAQAIKNTASQSAKAVRVLAADHRVALSGTPVENHLGELWSLFEFLNPGMLGRAKAFRDWVGRGRPEADAGGAESLGTLSRALRPFFLRRTKEAVLDDLPEKTEQVIVCQLGRADRRRYDELRDHYRAALLGRGATDEGIRSGQMHVLEALLRLRQCACHPALIDPARKDEGSAKVDALLARLAEVADEGHKALVFSQFTSLLAIVRARLDAAGIAYAYLDGRTRKRKEKVERFQADPACPVFLVSLKAGGHGLNLTAADYVFLLDPWWNPAVEAQAIDRAHRLGRTRPVHAYRLIAADTVEQRIQELQAGKRALAEAIFAEGRGGAITREELERLLA